MDIHHLEQLPDEIREPVQNLIEELATIQDVSKLNEKRGRVLSDELIEILTGIGISPGDILDAERTSLYHLYYFCRSELISFHQFGFRTGHFREDGFVFRSCLY